MVSPIDVFQLGIIWTSNSPHFINNRLQLMTLTLINHELLFIFGRKAQTQFFYLQTQLGLDSYFKWSVRLITRNRYHWVGRFYDRNNFLISGAARKMFKINISKKKRSPVMSKFIEVQQVHALGPNSNYGKSWHGLKKLFLIQYPMGWCKHYYARALMWKKVSSIFQTFLK